MKAHVQQWVPPPINKQQSTMRTALTVNGYSVTKLVPELGNKQTRMGDDS